MPFGGYKHSGNGREFGDYFPNKLHQQLITDPFKVLDLVGSYDVIAKITGGGPSGQAGALRLAIARSLRDQVPDLEIEPVSVPGNQLLSAFKTIKAPKVEQIFVESADLTSEEDVRLLEILAQSGTAFSDVLASYRTVIWSRWPTSGRTRTAR